MITEKPITELLAPRQGDMVQMMGGEIRVKREISYAIQAANSNETLAQASAQSVAKAIFNAALAGLSLSPVMKEAYLVPKRIDGKWEAVLFPSYQGLVKIIAQSGAVKKLYAHVVYEGDAFEYNYGTAPSITHKPAMKSKDIKAVYAVAVLPDDSLMIEVMSKAEIDEIMMRSDSGKKGFGPWKTDYAEMSRKTVIRRLFKYVPKTDKYEQAAQAVALDEQDYPATMGQIGYIETLLKSSAIDHDERGRITRQLSEMTSVEAEQMIEYLQSNQLDPITAGMNYNQGDITKHVGKLTQTTIEDQEDKQ